MMIFQNILTTVGQQKRAIAEAGGASLNITHFKIGDSNGQYYEPIESQIDLVNVKYTANFTGQSQILVNPTSPNEALYKCFVPAEIGGFTIRELGLFDSDNDLILICKLPAQDKFALDSGLYQPLTFTPKIIFTNPQTQAVLTVSSQIIATQNFVNQEITNHTNYLQAHTELLSEKVNKDGSIDFTGLQKYATDLTHTDDKHLIHKKYADGIKD
jgi:phage-related tail fiber protein